MATKSKFIKAVDLYCGAGGFSEGLEEACKRVGIRLWLVAVNHWADAIETHTRNHPEAIHLCADLDAVDPLKVVPGKHLDLLIASPECTHHSNARGGKPRDDQSRMQPWTIINWAAKVYISTLIIENVTEFIDWGPLDSKGIPIARKNGEMFRAWVDALKAMDYRVEWRTLNAMHFGAATSREHLRMAQFSLVDTDCPRLRDDLIEKYMTEWAAWLPYMPEDVQAAWRKRNETSTKPV